MPTHQEFPLDVSHRITGSKKSIVAILIRYFFTFATYLCNVTVHAKKGLNTEGNAEYNFLKDPVSANTVLTQCHCPITLLPVEPCASTGFTQEWRFAAFKDTSNPTIQMFNKVEEKCWGQWDPTPELKVWWQCDIFLACTIVNEKVVKRSVSTCARVEVDGSRRGRLVLDSTKKHNVKIITELDARVLKDEILKSAEV